MFLRFLLF
ncbi:hypothetical protein CP8484711_0169A, partial [Chlamydia psittaci 84-8471/1]